MFDEDDRSEGTRPIPDEAKEVGQSVVKLGSTNNRERDNPIKTCQYLCSGRHVSKKSSIQNSRGSPRFPIKRLARGEDKWNVTICEGCRERPLTTSLDTHSSRRSRMNLETSIEVSLYDWLG